MYIVHSSFSSYSKSLGFCTCIYIRSYEDKFPAILFLLFFNHLLNLIIVIIHTCIFHSVRCDNKYGLIGSVFFSCIFMNIDYMFDCTTNCVQKCSRSSYKILIICYLIHFFNRHSVMNNLGSIIKQYC